MSFLISIFGMINFELNTYQKKKIELNGKDSFEIIKSII